MIVSECEGLKVGTCEIPAEISAGSGEPRMGEKTMGVAEAEMGTGEIKESSEQHILNTYGSRKLAFVKGRGMHLWDADGKEYLDFFAGIAVVNLGHCHPDVTAAVCEQAQTLVHTSNLYYIKPQADLANLLAELSFADRWFFSNCGASANEAAIKIARRYWHIKGQPKPIVLSANGSFHGRTYAALTATGQPKYQEGFAPLLPGIKHFEYNDIESLKSAITPDVGAVLLEPIQGESGVRVPDVDYLKRVRDVCDKHKILLILDEVQTGIGRTGKLFAHMHSQIYPDIMTLAKGLANGVPIGAMGCRQEVAQGFTVGSHASTFGGNFLACAAAIATLKAITADGFLQHAHDAGEYFKHKLQELSQWNDVIADVRGKGLMIGVEFKKPAAPVIEYMLEHGYIVGPAGPNVVRFVPPLIVKQGHIDKAVECFGRGVGRL
jgi:acetylornithine/N-succinyldiaminopimelate aminotransferase